MTYAIATAAKTKLPHMGPTFGPHQCGAGGIRGAEQDHYELRASHRHEDSSSPDSADQCGAAALDLANAVGKGTWAYSFD